MKTVPVSDRAPKRRRKTKAERWLEYAILKRELEDRHLSPEDHEAAIKALAKMRRL